MKNNIWLKIFYIYINFESVISQKLILRSDRLVAEHIWADGGGNE